MSTIPKVALTHYLEHKGDVFKFYVIVGKHDTIIESFHLLWVVRIISVVYLLEVDVRCLLEIHPEKMTP